MSPDADRPFLHAQHSHATTEGRFGPYESFTGIRNSEAQLIVGVFQDDSRFSGTRVFGDVLQRLLTDPENAQLQITGQQREFIRNTDINGDSVILLESFSNRFERPTDTNVTKGGRM